MEVFIGNLVKIKAKRGQYHWYKVTDIREGSIVGISYHDYVLKTENPEVAPLNKKDILEVIENENSLV